MKSTEELLYDAIVAMVRAVYPRKDSEEVGSEVFEMLEKLKIE